VREAHAAAPRAMDLIKAIWAYRGFIAGNVKREFQARYQNSLLGAGWAILNPLAMIVVYTVIFAQLMRARLPGVDSTFAYSIYLCAGVLTWGFFAEITGRSLTMFLENANLLKKISFPRICLPVAVAASACMNFAVVFGLFTIFLVVSGNFPGIVYVALLPLLAIHLLFALGLGVTLGVLNVFFRDVGQFFGIFLQFWFWLTPIVYPISVLPERLRPLMWLNPLSHLTAGYQQVLVNGQWPAWGDLVGVTVLALVLCALGLHLFKRRSGEMVDEL
jgi:lipopolysaccharide transport system permease protein